MRTALRNHREVAEKFAENSQPEGRASNMFFEDDTIYSYGRHFPIAKRIEPDLDLYLFTVRDYSVSTAKHKNMVAGALLAADAYLIYVDQVRPMDSAAHKMNVRRMLERIKNSLEKAERARKYTQSYLHQAEYVADSLHDYLAIFLPHHNLRHASNQAIFNAARSL